MKTCWLTLLAGWSMIGADALAAETTSPQPPIALHEMPPDSVHIGGWLGERIDSNISGRLTHVPMDELLAGFRHRPGKQNWIGEHIGKWIHAACLAYKYSGDKTLKAMLDHAVPKLLATQLPDGYLGTYDDTKRWKSWDVWVHKYDLLGLLAYHQLTGDQASLTASRRIADMLIAGFAPDKRDIVKSGEHMGMAATSVLEPMAKLFVITGDKHYLDFCRYIVDSWEQPHGPKLLSSLTKTDCSVYKTANAKAYEMMSNLVGLCELYRVVGDERYLKAARNAWEDIYAHQMYITGGVSFKEHFQPDNELTDAGDVAETCADVTWMQLCIQLFTITGDNKYFEPIERLIYNHLTAAQASDGDDWCYFTPLRGTKPFRKEVNCCHSSGPRGIGLIPTIAYSVGDRLLCVNLLAESRFQGTVPGAGNVKLTQETTYPQQGKVIIAINPETPMTFSLRVRVPLNQAVSLTLNGEPVESSASDGTLTIIRQWQEHDTIELSLDTQPRWIQGKGTHHADVAAAYGPFILCASTRWNPRLFAPESIAVKPNTLLNVISDTKGLPGAKDALLVSATLATPPDSPARQIILGPYAMVQHEPFAVWMLTTQQPADIRLQPGPNTNTVFMPTQYTDNQWRTRRLWLREQIKLAAGMFPDVPRKALNTHIFGKLIRDGYTIEKVLFESSPGIYVTGNLYAPLNLTGKCPVVACPHGHWKNGRLQNDESCSVPARCITLARNGAIALAYDIIGCNDSGLKFKHGDKALDTPETALWGIGHFQLQSFNSSRVIDFLLSLPNADSTRVGVTGASGGGTQTFTLAAVDDRITCSAPVNMISSTMQGGCVCENAPVLRIGTNNMEIAGTFAPKPMLMVSASGDWTKRTPDVEFPFIRTIYNLHKATDRVANVHIDAPHNYNRESREAMYHFFGRWLLNREDADIILEGPIPQEKPEDMLVFANSSDIPANLPTTQRIIELKKAEINESLKPFMPTNKATFDDLRNMVATALEHITGTSEQSAHGYRMLLSQPMPSQSNLRYDGWIDSAGRVVRMAILTHPTETPSAYTICVDPNGLDAVDKYKGLVSDLIAAGHRIVFIEPFNTGKSRRLLPSTQANERASGFFTTFNPTDAAETAHDIYVSLMVAIKNGFDRDDIPVMKSLAQTNLIGFSTTGPICLVARAMLPEAVVKSSRLHLVVDMNGFDADSDTAYLDQLFMPYIRRIGGLPTITAACADGPMLLHNTAGKLNTLWLDQAALATKAPVHLEAAPANAGTVVAWIKGDK